MTNIRKLVPLSLFTHPASQPSYATSREQNMILSHLNTQSFIYSPGGGLGRGGAGEAHSYTSRLQPQAKPAVLEGRRPITSHLRLVKDVQPQEAFFNRTQTSHFSPIYLSHPVPTLLIIVC